jgi:hypothetical protein
MVIKKGQTITMAKIKRTDNNNDQNKKDKRINNHLQNTTQIY